MESLLEDRLWEKLFSEAQQAFKEGQHDAALRDFDAAVNVAEQFDPDDIRLARSLLGLGVTYMIKGQLDLADEKLQRALLLNTNLRGETHPDSLTSLRTLGMVADKLKKFEQAEGYYTKAISILEKKQSNHPDIKVLREQQALSASHRAAPTRQEPPVGMPPVVSKAAKAPAGQADTRGMAKPAGDAFRPPTGPAAGQPAKSLSPVSADIAASKALGGASAGPPGKTAGSGAGSPGGSAGVPEGSSSLSGGASGFSAPIDKAPRAPVPFDIGGPEHAAAAVDPDALSGVVIDNRYQVFGRIGEGGMSAIYRGKHLFMDRPVAVKILHKHLTASEKVRERFKQEARTASMLQHPNIVAVHDFGEAHGFFYLVMDFVDGVSLADLIKQMDKLPPDRCVRILQQICDGLQHAHDNGILHRDLKPSNIMLLETPTTPDLVKIVDFGIATFIEKDEHSLQLTQTGETVGSPLYMSPEQCRGERLDARSDIYSLGCLAYKTLAGVPPFSGNNQIDVYIKHMQIPPPAFSTVCPESPIPEQLERIVRKTLEKNPADRFTTMAELRGALSLLSAEQHW